MVLHNIMYINCIEMISVNYVRNYRNSKLHSSKNINYKLNIVGNLSKDINTTMDD